VWFADAKFHGVLDRKLFVRHFLSGIYFAQYHVLNIVVGLLEKLIPITT
jgi:hypothetical protein